MAGLGRIRFDQQLSQQECDDKTCASQYDVLPCSGEACAYAPQAGEELAGRFGACGGYEPDALIVLEKALVHGSQVPVCPCVDAECPTGSFIDCNDPLPSSLGLSTIVDEALQVLWRRCLL